MTKVTFDLLGDLQPSSKTRNPRLRHRKRSKGPKYYQKEVKMMKTIHYSQNIYGYLLGIVFVLVPERSLALIDLDFS